MTGATFEYGSAAWQAERANYIGASDVAAILGVSPYASAYDIWIAKKHGILPAENTAMEMGHLLEPIVAEKYRRQFPDASIELRGTVAHPHLPWLRATIDRMVTTPHAQFPLEIKSTSAYLGDKWGSEGSDEIPDHVVLQVQTQLLVLNMPMAHVAVLIGGNDYRAPYVIEADRELQELILDQCEDFHARYLLGDEQPEITGPNVEAHLKRKYATHTDMMLAAAPNVNALIAEFAQAKRAVEDAEVREKELKTQLMALIGTNKGIIGAAGRCTWAETKGRESIDTKGLIAHLNVPADVLQCFTKIGAPFRTFRYTAAK